MTRKVVVGAIGGAFGVHGEVRLKSFCAQPEAIAAYAPLSDASGRVYPRIRLTGQTSGALTARIDGIATREEAEALKGTELFADRDRMPEPDEEEYYHSDLVGLAVFDTGGAEIGRIRAVQNHGAGDLLEIAVPGRSSTLLLPFTQAVVPTIDLAGGRVVADPPDGLL